MSRSIGLHSLAVSVPDRVLTNDPRQQQHPRPVANDPFAGARERRVLPAGGTALDLETRAAREALSAAKREPDEIDLLICSSSVGDHHGIGGATYLARELSLKGAAWNIESAGASAQVALQAACSLIASGQHRYALVVTSCAHSRATSEDDPIASQVGDAATAIVVGEVADQAGLLGSHSVHTGATRATLTGRLTADTDGQVGIRLCAADSSGDTLARLIEQTLEVCVHRALDKAEVAIEDIDHWIFSTPSAVHASLCARTLGIVSRHALSVHPLYADTGPALLGLNLLHAAHWKRFQPGELVLIYTADSASNGSASVIRWSDVALGELPSDAVSERVERFTAETLALYRLRRLDSEVLAPAHVAGSADRCLHRLVSDYATLAIDEPGIMTLFAEYHDTVTADEVLPEILERRRSFIATLETHIATLLGQQDQSSRIDPTVAALSLLGIVHWGICSYRTERHLSRDEAIEQVTRLALHGLAPQPPMSPTWPTADPMTA